ncbi:alpha/beta fold hydrolase [Paracoccus suum]|uniref:Alpha/beta fold hydrolase n=1 Tax=Paracoccus suum TaxID=2259340 RepID=A0A344PM51_9RHOB|nr:alpha/beta fold hydrolase [Paracoccus suum]AXC50456.1 alpha/beta fold hydrolase [Paracoccus suum]
MKLNTIITGEPGALPPVILAHGLLGSARNLGGLARRLAGRRVIQVDMRNHGDSGWSDDHSYAALAGDLAEVIAAEGGIADVVGHSMGGKAAMALALLHPQMVRRLVVLDIAPLAYAHSQTPLIDAMAATDLTSITRRSEADARLAERVEDAGTRAFVLQSLELRPGEPARWKMNLAALRAEMAELVGWPEGLAEGAFDGPVLAIAGAESDYISREGEAALRRYFPQIEVQRIAGAGHWVHADAAQAVGDAVATFIG